MNAAPAAAPAAAAPASAAPAAAPQQAAASADAGSTVGATGDRSATTPSGYDTANVPRDILAAAQRMSEYDAKFEEMNAMQGQLQAQLASLTKERDDLRNAQSEDQKRRTEENRKAIMAKLNLIEKNQGYLKKLFPQANIGEFKKEDYLPLLAPEAQKDADANLSHGMLDNYVAFSCAAAEFDRVVEENEQLRQIVFKRPAASEAMSQSAPRRMAMQGFEPMTGSSVPSSTPVARPPAYNPSSFGHGSLTTSAGFNKVVQSFNQTSANRARAGEGAIISPPGFDTFGAPPAMRSAPVTRPTL